MKTTVKVSIFLFGAFAMIMLAHKAITSPMSPATIPQCKNVRYPQVCQRTFEKCSGIDLDDACIAVAQLEGELGHSVTHPGESGMSQNNVKGEKQ